MTDLGILFEYLWQDNDMIELGVKARSACFQGRTQLSVGRDELSAVARHLADYPRNKEDVREVLLGDLAPNSFGGLQFSLRIIDMAGHAILTARLKGNRRDNLPLYEECTLVAPLEPAAIDTFLPALRLIEANLGGSAMLRIIPA
jgi:hypothetical protein